MGNLEKSKAGSLSSIKHRKPLWATRCLQRLFLWRQPLLLIEQVIINLLENAIVHSGSKLPVELTVVCGEKQVSFHVRDYGKGIAAQNLDTIFDGYTPDESHSSDSHKGMGIGLSICKTIIHAHHGSIIAKNHSDGAEFIFTLPLGENNYESKANCRSH